MKPQLKSKKKEGKDVARFSSIKKSLKRSTWAEKMELKNQRKAIKEREERAKAQKNKMLEEKRLRREENKRRKEENAKKAEIVVPVKNPAKLKRLKKKELKKIRKV